MSKRPLERPCPCGSGKEYGQCCGEINACRLIHFPHGKRSNYYGLIEQSITNLLEYAKKYFVHWDTIARAKFLSACQGLELNQQMLPFYREWYVVNYRPYSDVSPLIDFYLVENEDVLTPRQKSIYISLKNSCISIYQIVWIKNNTAAIQDIFTGQENIVERDFGSITQFVEVGTLLLTRIINVDNMAIVTGKPVKVYSLQKAYILEEINSIRINEKNQELPVFLREYGHVLCGLVADLLMGVKKNGIKSRSLLLSDLERRTLGEKIFQSHRFSLLDPNEPWLKFTWHREKSMFMRIYLGKEMLIVFGEEIEDIRQSMRELNQMLGVRWNDEEMDLAWNQGVTPLSEEEAEEIRIDILFDKHLDEWVTLPHPSLEELTPVEAMYDIRGRVLLESLLFDLEMMELRARSRGEYFYPTDVIRKKLGLEKNQKYRELLHPEAVAMKVEKHRSYQQLSPYITAYNWLNEDYAQVAIAIFDQYTSHPQDEKRLAWLLYLWNEFTAIFQPRITRLSAWIAALEHTLSARLGVKASYGNTARDFGLSTSIVSKNAYLMDRHFRRFPLDFTQPIQKFPVWEEMDFQNKIQTYDEVAQHLNLYAYMMENRWGTDEKTVRDHFYDRVNTQGHFWDEFRKRVYGEFFKDYFLLDYIDDQGNSLVGLFWKNQASRFPPHLRTAALNVMMSSVGVYRVLPKGDKELVFIDYFSGEQFCVVGNLGDDIHEYIIPDMLVLCRLLPLGRTMWISEPLFVVLEELEALFEKNLHIFMEDLTGHDPCDPMDQKMRGEFAIKAYISAVNDFENEALNLITQPLQINWRYAYIMDQEVAFRLIQQCEHFTPLYQSPERSSFAWVRMGRIHDHQWGYLLLEKNCVFLAVPPGKDIDSLSKDLRKSIKSADVVVAMRHFDTTIKHLRLMERNMVADLAEYLERKPALSLAFLRQDSFADEESEWMQGIFILQFGSLLMNYMKEKKLKREE